MTCVYVSVYRRERRTESPVCVSFYESEEDLRLFGAVVMGDCVLSCVLPNVCDRN